MRNFHANPLIPRDRAVLLGPIFRLGGPFFTPEVGLQGTGRAASPDPAQRMQEAWDALSPVFMAKKGALRPFWTLLHDCFRARSVT